ncbi:hypothetical protein D2E22_1133 [Bifidobacterium castoris]|uniref:Uncharacterized protein n=2 Tax=Bifidobacterium castoris TaxID=2306972 RepID=A0A430F6H3_9BIFI|nr:hypothetical protein D2E22_1133 [Bifidobacterium castoris]
MALKEIMREYTDAASQLARDYYHTVRQAWAEYTGQEFPGFNDGGLIDTDRILWQIQHGMANTDYPGLKYRDVKTGSNKAGLTMNDLWPDMTDIDDAQQFIGDMIRTALRSQTQQCMRRDPTQPRWARVPHGKTCAFCVMLASRGFAYLSAETGGKGGTRFHDDCDCRVIPSWGRQTLKGYDPDEYHRLYRNARDIASSTAKRTVLKALRRIDPESVTDGVFPDDNKMSKDNSLSYRKWHEHVNGVKERKRKDRTRLFQQYSVCKIPPLTPLEPPVWDDDTLIRFTAKTWNHSLFGYDAGGGHLFGYGWIYGKPEFPED